MNILRICTKLIVLTLFSMVNLAIANPLVTIESEQKISALEGGFGSGLWYADLFGYSVADIGDLNGDGNTDIAVGTLDDDGGFNTGAIWILFLNADGTVQSKRKISATQGDFSGVLSYNALFGVYLDSLDDLDGDGVTDLIVGNYGDDDGGPDRGAAWVIFLNPDGTVKDHQKISDLYGNFVGDIDNSDWFGRDVAKIGDLDGDGVTEIAIGAVQDDDGGLNRGAVWILFMNTNGTVKAHQKISATQGGFNGLLDNGDLFGQAIDGIGDIDADGVPDIAVSAFSDDDGGINRGAVWILFLKADGTVKAEQKISDTEGAFTGELNDDIHFGRSVAKLGDLNMDGIPDLAVGTATDDDGGLNKGSVWLLFLNADGTVKAESKISDTQGGFNGPLDDSDLFGTSVTLLSDLDGNGIPELAVGTAGDDDGYSEAGAVWILFLKPNLPPTINISNISAPADGFMPFENISSFPATVGSSPVRMDVTVGGTSVVDHVTVNGIEAMGGPIDWTAGNIILSTGVNTLKVIATTSMGISSETSIEVTLDLDLDNDGIENDIDRQFTVPGLGIIGGPKQPSTLFSDQFGPGLGSGPIQVTVSQDSGTAYVSNHLSNSVSVLDTATLEVVATIPVGNRPYESALTPDGGKLYVPNISSNTVSVVDTSNNKVLSSIPVGNYPYSTGATPDGRILVAEYGSNLLGVIDTTSDTRLLGIPTNQGPISLTMAPDRPRVYVSASGAHVSSWIDTNTLTIERNVGISNPRAADTNPDGSRLFVTEPNYNRVIVFDTDSGVRTATIGVGGLPIDVVVSPDGLSAYTANHSSNTVSVIDIGTSTVRNTIPVQFRPYGLDISPDGLRTYVANYSSHSVSVIDNASNMVVDTIVGGIDGRTYGLVTDAGDQTIKVSNEDPEPVKGVRISTTAEGGSAPASIDVCEWPFTMTFGAGSDFAFTCPGSVAVEIFTGPVELSFNTPDDVMSSITLESGFSLLVESPEFVTDPQMLQVIASEDNPGPVTLMVGEVEIMLEPGDETVHSDGDGIPDNEDACPVSDLSETVVIDGCESGVTNYLAANGCTISDDIAECVDNAKNHGKFVSCVSHEVNVYKKAGFITGQDKDKIMDCAGGANIP